MDVVDVTISDRGASLRFGSLGACVLATLVLGPVACDGGPPDEPEALEGAELVAGTSLSRHGLLVLPHEGGAAEFRAIDDPSTVRWTGRVSLPAASEAHPVGAAVVLRHGDEVSLYQPSPEALTPLRGLPADARWVGSTAGGAYVAEGWVLAITADGAREVRVDGAVSWAAPAPGGRVAVLHEGDAGATLSVFESDSETGPARSRAVGSSGPAALTRDEVVLPAADADGSGLVAWSLAELEPVHGMDLEVEGGALALSPSQHRLYVAPAARARLVSVDRYEWRTAARVGLEEPAQRLRPGVLGDHLLLYDGSRAWTVRADGESRAEIPGAWRADLPLALPDGRTLATVEAGLRLYDAEGAELGVVEGPVAAWWLPLRWGPRAPVTAVALAPEDTAETVEPPPNAERRIGLLTMGSVSGRTVDAPPAGGPRGSDFEVAPRPRIPAAPSGVSSTLPRGFYAVATSSRQLESLLPLRRALEGSGYTTHVFPRIDEANEIWYRLMVGPYASRDDAERATQELRRSRGIDAWIHEVAAGGPERGP